MREVEVRVVISEQTAVARLSHPAVDSVAQGEILVEVEEVPSGGIEGAISSQDSASEVDKLLKVALEPGVSAVARRQAGKIEVVDADVTA